MFELNVDRAANADATAVIGPADSDADKNVKDTGYIYPFVVKGVQQVAFRDMTRDTFNTYSPGDILTGSY